MNHTSLKVVASALGAFVAVYAATITIAVVNRENQMRLGNFSISLTVKDIEKSREFYEKLGFKPIGGDIKQRWLILQNDTATVGLFQGMFEKNMLTFNPGWDRNAKALPDFDDVRDLQKALEARGIQLSLRADEASSGPAHITLTDPDGNPILIDQHVPRNK